MIGPLEDWEKLMASPVAVLGAGVSGRGVCALLHRLGWKFRVYDEAGIQLSPAKLRSSSLVVVSPGFRPDHPWLLLARQMKIRVLGELDFASCFTASPITAITGTNGKTTVATLLHHALGKLGHITSTAGNIGLPLSQFVADQVDLNSRILLEVSSFQSRNISYLTPDRGIWTNFAEDHLDYHGTMEDYFVSKLSLLQRCKGEIFVGKSVLAWANRFSLTLPDSVQVISPSRQTGHSFDNEHFLGSHPQRENYALALAYGGSLGIPEEEFFLACQDYKAEPHRLAKIHQIDEISFWNDSKATNFDAVIAACKSMRDPIFWIGGGQSKGVMMDEFSRELSQYISKAFVLGDVGEEMTAKINAFGTPASQCFSLKEAVESAFNEANGRVSILLSPGFSSFDQFRNFEERGETFNRCVQELKKRFATSTQELLY
jgi:UDP-N-acetylmuramoylalanine--D-glutamate ligase